MRPTHSHQTAMAATSQKMVKRPVAEIGCTDFADALHKDCRRRRCAATNYAPEACRVVSGNGTAGSRLGMVMIRRQPVRQTGAHAVHIRKSLVPRSFAIEVGPEGRYENEFAIGRLPKQEIRQPLFATGADDEIGVRQIGRIHENRTSVRR